MQQQKQKTESRRHNVNGKSRGNCTTAKERKARSAETGSRSLGIGSGSPGMVRLSPETSGDDWGWTRTCPGSGRAKRANRR